MTMQLSSTQNAWQPSEKIKKTANITHWMEYRDITDVQTFHRWTVDHYQDFWMHFIQEMAFPFKKSPQSLVDLSEGLESLRWLPGAEFNVVDACFKADTNALAVKYQDPAGTLQTLTYGELRAYVNRIANSLCELGFKPGDAIGIAMPMHLDAVAIYLGIILMGGVVVSIADSFSSNEMETRLTIANAKALFTQDVILRQKKIPLYEKTCAAKAPKTIVVVVDEKDAPTLRENDLTWRDFLDTNTSFTSVTRDAMHACNILFSSGTTGTPKAIVWNHSTPIKIASDAYFHQNIQAGDVLAWPTNLGWMMGPWLIFATFMHGATISLYTDVPKDRAFGEFVEHAGVTMLGIVPTIVATWRQTKCMEGLNWEKIKVFSSTGECSNPDDMHYLMQLAGNKPVIEYCGGTEIGGAYVSSTVVEPNYPSLFSTPTMGMDFVILDEAGHMSNLGEVAIIPPSFGLSTTLLNADHHKTYFENMPKTNDGKLLRRHGDQIMQLPNGYYTILGRVDDTMNLGGIKISAAEIERALVGLTDVIEVAAIAVSPPNNGPSLLVIYTATNTALDKAIVQKEMQQRINQRINPLFKIHDVVFVATLPKTASNKIMRRLLRDEYQKV